jgi:hypothetical protein
VRACAADLGISLDDSDRLALFDGLHGGAFAAGSAADYDDIEMRLRHRIRR